MKKYLSTTIRESRVDMGLLFLRIAAGGYMLTHGIPKLMKLMGGDLAFGDPIGIGAGPSLVLTIFAEVICAILIVIGLGTRLATIPLIITMLVAAFIVHGADPIGKKELALIYFAMYFVLFLMGSGKYSLDKRLFG
jgi:putative oxidoreductase